MHYAVAYGWPDIVEYLISANADPNSVNSWNNTPASIAFLKGHFGIASYLLKLPSNLFEEYCIDINATFVDDNGKTLSMQLIMNVNQDTVEQLKFLGEKMNITFTSLDK